MKRFAGFLILLIALSGVGGASEVNLPEKISMEDGTVYEEVRLVSQTPAEIVIIHSAGAQNLKIADLSSDLKELLGYSEALATAYELEQLEEAQSKIDRQREAEKKRKEAIALELRIKNETYMIRGKVERITPEGILIETWEPSRVSFQGVRVAAEEGEKLQMRFRKYATARPKRAFGSIFIAGHPQVDTLADGSFIDVNAYRNGTQAVDTITAKKYVFLENFMP